jgi:TRAP-type C4-dicarboxylate transport system substrate-binding protein
MTESKKITWLLFHEPIDLFLRTAKAFSQEINKLTDGRLEINVYTMDEYKTKFNKGSEFDPINLINFGEVHMSQLPVGRIANWQTPDFFALDLPFLFSDHDHASRVLDGEIGNNLLSGLEDTTPVRGLCFTYSGGFRVFAADKPINSMDDLKGMKMGTRLNPVFFDTAEAFGCIPESLTTDEFKIDKSEFNALQTTLPRYTNEVDTQIHRYVTNTKHSMYLTSIVIGKKFWNSLDTEDQMAIQSAAMTCARLERTWTIEDAEAIAKDKNEQQRLGIIDYREFSDVEAAKLKDSVQPVYEKYIEIFTPGLVNKILDA